MQLIADGAAAALVGVDMMDQVVPFHFSANATEAEGAPEATEVPTATQNVGLTHEIALETGG